MYRVAVEAILGLRLRGSRLTVDPCIPSTWKGFSIAYRHGGATYRIEVENPGNVCRGVCTLEVDGNMIDEPSISLQDDGAEHNVRVVLGPRDVK